MLRIAPIPVKEELTDGRWMQHRWVKWLLELITVVQKMAALPFTETQTGKTAATTSTYTVTGAGLHRLSYTARVTTAAGTSSSVTVTVGWTDGGVACTQAFVPMTGNTTATTQSGSVLINADQATAVTCSTVYASNPASAMTYTLAFAVESLL